MNAKFFFNCAEEGPRECKLTIVIDRLGGSRFTNDADAILKMLSNS